MCTPLRCTRCVAVSGVPSVPTLPGVRLSRLTCQVCHCTRCAECVESAMCTAIMAYLSGVPGVSWCQVCRVCRQCQVYGYHDCAMDILTCVTELFANKHAGARDSSTRAPLPSLFDNRRYRAPSPPGHHDLSTWPRRHNPTRRPPVKPASLPSLQLSDNERRCNTKRQRHKRWANSRPTTASDADAEFSDATTASFTQ